MHVRGGFKIRGRQQAQPSDFDSNWKVIKSSFTEIHKHEKRELSYESLYRAGYKIVSDKQADKLYTNIIEFEKGWIKEEIIPELERFALEYLRMIEAGSAVAEDFVVSLISYLASSWEDYRQCVQLIADVMLYLDRSYSFDRHVYIGDACVQAFRDLVIFGSLRVSDERTRDFSSVLSQLISDQINSERDGKGINRAALSTLIRMLSSVPLKRLSIYHEFFLDNIVESSRKYYRDRAKMLSESVEPIEYFKSVQRILEDEASRCRLVLTDYTNPMLQKVIQEEMISSQIGSLLRSPKGLQHMINVGNIEDLRVVYKLNSIVSPDIVHICETLREIVTNMGFEMNRSVLRSLESSDSPTAPSTTTSAQKPNQQGRPDRAVNIHTAAALKWSEDLLSMKYKFDRIWEQAFMGNYRLQAEITDGFRDFINSRDFGRAPEYISLFIDANLRKNSKDHSSAQFEETLDRIIHLLHYVSSKDAMETYYRKHLGKRLLIPKGHDINIEKVTILRLKQELGGSFTSKFEVMLHDIEQSQEMSDQFRDRMEDVGKSVSSHINVLNGSAWPMDALSRWEAPEEILPGELVEMKKTFSSHYTGRHSGRVLQWHDGLSTVELKATFKAVPTKEGGIRERQHLLVVNAFGLAILLAFAEAEPDEWLTFDQLRARSKLTEAQLGLNLRVFCLQQRTRVLIKEPMTREINQADRFKYNEGYQSQFYRVNMSQMVVNKAETEKEKKSSDKDLGRERMVAIQGALVRILKHRKSMQHRELVSECIGLVSASFMPDIPTIKRAIEALVEKDYIDIVTEEGSTICNYVA